MASTANRTATVIGLCVDAHGEMDRYQIPNWIASQKTDTPEALFYACGRFAGKYVILVEENDKIYLWGDATCTLQVNYAFLKENVCVSFSDKITAKAFELGESEIAKDIRKKGANNHPLPYELTMYNGVRALLPNHYLDLNARKSVRINLKIPTGQAPTSVDDVVDSTLKLILNTAREYGKYYSFACAVTSGNDSRVVYAVLSKLGLDQERFTFRHKGFTDATGDIAVPHQFICADGKNHLIIDDMVAPEGFGERVREFLGNWQSPFFINLAYTYLQSFPNLAIPVLTFRTEEIPECVTADTGSVVPCNDYDALVMEIHYICTTVPVKAEACQRIQIYEFMPKRNEKAIMAAWAKLGKKRELLAG